MMIGTWRAYGYIIVALAEVGTGDTNLRTSAHNAIDDGDCLSSMKILLHRHVDAVAPTITTDDGVVLKLTMTGILDRDDEKTHGLPREDRGPALPCVPPDPSQRCDEEAAWYVWYAGARSPSCLCHDHLIDCLQGVRYGIVQMKRTPRWEPRT